MKVTCILVFLCITSVVKCSHHPAPPSVIHAPLDVITFEDITKEERRILAEFEDKLRHKRSGSDKGSGSSDIIGVVAKAIGQGIKKKIGQVAQASASASAGFSKGSSAGKSDGDHHYHQPYHHQYPVHDDHDDHDHDKDNFNWWSLKKSLLNTLLQAVKAIKGGVIAIKGQLIKGSGYVISGSGKLLAAKGDAVTKLGKNIASSALLLPPKKDHYSSTGHGEYESGPGHYSAPSAPEEVYHSAPSASGPGHHPDHYPPHYAGHSSHGHQAGLLILKKAPKGHQNDHHQDTKNSAHKHAGPSFGTIVAKFLGASSSLDPHKPEPFGHTAGGDTHHSIDSYQSQHDLHKPEPYAHTASGDTHHNSHISDTYAHTGSGNAPHDINDGINIPPTASDYGINNNNAPPTTGSGNLEPPPTSYGIPFEKAPSYLDQNVEDYITSDSKNTHNSIPPPNGNNNIKHPEPVFQTPTANLPNPSSSNQQPTADYLTAFANLDPRNPSDNQHISINTHSVQYNNNNNNVQPNNDYSDSDLKQPGYLENTPPVEGLSAYSSKNQLQLNFNQYPPLSGQSVFHQSISDPSNYPNIGDYPQGFPPAVGNGAIPFTNEASPYQSQGLYNSGSQLSVNNIQDNLPSASMLVGNQVSNSPPSLYLESPKENIFLPTPNTDQVSALPTRYTFVDSYPNRNQKRKRKPSRSKHTSSKRPSSSRPKPTDLNIVKSVAYELGPNGPKRLT